MSDKLQRIQELINRPTESLATELKQWIDPNSKEGIAKIVKACLAIRNYNGGYIVIGFNDKSRKPDLKNAPKDVTKIFHLDKIQSIVSKHASQPMEIHIHFPERDRQIFPVISIEPGIKSPVVSKSQIIDGKGNILLKADTVYIRTLSSNNTPSTSQATWKDWPAIVDKCFDNREADVGRFLRRHLPGIENELTKYIHDIIIDREKPEIADLPTERIIDTDHKEIEDLPTERNIYSDILEFINYGKNRYSSVTKERNLTLPKHGCWIVALIISNNNISHSANPNFLNLIKSSNPNYTGWPIWLVSSDFKNESSRPYVYDKAWEEYIIQLDSDFKEIDFIRLEPNGRFFHRRAFEDDLKSNIGIKPNTVLDFSLVILRTAEAIGVGIELAKAMGCDIESTDLFFAFNWEGLKGRELVSWVFPSRRIFPGRKAYQDEISTTISLPLDTPLSAISQYVYNATSPLYELFDGFDIGQNIVDELTTNVIERKS